VSSQEQPKLPAAAQEYARLWGACTARALGQLQGATFTPTPQEPVSAAFASASPAEPAAATPTDPSGASPAEPAAAPPAEPLAATAADPAAAPPGEALSLHFKVSGRIVGEQLFRVSKPDGVRLAQMLMAEPLDPAAPFSEGYADALNEIFRQFGGLASAASKAQYGGDVGFNLESTKTVEWKPASTAIWSFAAPQVAPIQWTLLLSPELLAAIESAQEAAKSASAAPPVAPEPAATVLSPSPSGTQTAPPPAPPAATRPAQPAFPKPAPPPAPAASVVETESAGTNLDLLLDVVLEATLRFGQREMLLRDILELHPGSVVELNRKIQEPAELLVAGRVVAHGEVVIVDGTYGLRITDVAHPHQRLGSVEA
jgi:flagellar motor switch protein FliN